MSDEMLVDARGLSCPEPVLMTKNALKEIGGKAFRVAVSSATARDNVERTLVEAKRQVTVKEQADDWIIEVAAT